jgi:fibrillarin-like pre-rRNA processing protein
MKQGTYQGVFEEDRKLFTENLVPGAEVYGEGLVECKGVEYREWNPRRSKLAAAFLKGIKPFLLGPKSTVLYLGAASGTTVSHVSDIAKEGLVFALEFSPEVFSELFLLSLRRKNIVPLLADASRPEEYYHRLAAVDVVYQDVAQRDQVDIFLSNCQLFLKKGGFGLLCVKARSIDVGKRPKQIFAEVREQLKLRFRIEDYRILQPLQKDHAVFLIRRG